MRKKPYFLEENRFVTFHVVLNGAAGGALKFKGRNKVLISSRQINENCCVTCPEKVAQKLSIPYVILLENNDFPAGVGGGRRTRKSPRNSGKRPWAQKWSIPYVILLKEQRFSSRCGGGAGKPENHPDILENVLGSKSDRFLM